MTVWRWQAFRCELGFVIARVRIIHEHRMDLEYMREGPSDAFSIRKFESWHDASVAAELKNCG
jgi:hypothetical protein